MNYFDMEIGAEPIMGITKNTADRVLRRQMRYGGEMKTRMGSTIEYMDMRLLSHRHNCAGALDMVSSSLKNRLENGDVHFT